MNCNICKMNAIIRSMACTDCDHGKNFWKIFERSKLGEQRK